MPVHRVLITNCWLRSWGGTEMYVRDLSSALRKRGYEPTVFSPMLGDVADDIRTAGVVVTDDLTTLTDEPDVLQCHHNYDAIAALSRFPDLPGIFVKHGVAPGWLDETSLHPRLLRHVAVDQLCLDAILAAGVPAERTTVIANGVDTARFVPRDPLPPRPRRALVFSNYVTEENSLPALREACARMGIEMDVVGAGAGASTTRPEEVLPGYDLVFAKARAAVEALAVGCAVVVSGMHGMAGMATYADLPEWRRWNLGRSLLTTPHDVDSICAEIDRYDADDAARCRDFVREHWSLDAMVDALVAEYHAVAASWDPADADPRAELRALAGPMSRLGPLSAEMNELEVVRAELAEALPYVEQTPRLVEAWRHEEEQARLLRVHLAKLKALRAAKKVTHQPDTAWLVVGRGTELMVGPERALAGHREIRGRVHLAEPALDLGPVSAEHAVAESGVRSFVVAWHQLPDGRTLAANPVGGNQVSWHPDSPTDFGVTPASDDDRTSVHVRFVLRHLTTTLLQQDLGGRSIHAVSAASGDGVLAVAGPTRSGKTRMVNHLIAAGLLGAVIDDDCPVLAPGGVLGTLVPARYEVARAVCLPLRNLVLLTDDGAGVRRSDAATGRRFLEDTAVPWPAPWLPAPGRRVTPELPGDLSVVAAPGQDEAAFPAVADLVSSG